MIEISGIALKPGSTTTGHSGITKEWLAIELKKASDSLEGKPVTVGFDMTTEGRVGTVTSSGYVEGEGVRYTAELDERQINEKDIEENSVAPRLFHDAIDDDIEPVTVTNVEFDGLGLVPEATEGVGEHEIIDNGSTRDS